MVSFNFLLPLTIIFSAFFAHGLAWQIADDCTGNTLTLVNAAMPEAINMAIYAKYRAADPNNNRLGTPLQSFLGASSENDETSLNLVQTWMQNVFNVASAPSSVDSGVLIHCSDAHLKQIGNSGRTYVDNTRGKAVQVTLGNAPPGVVPTNTPCGGFMQGFYYRAVVVLCNDGPMSAFTQSYGGATLGGWRTAGRLKESSRVTANGIDAMAQYLSSKILHELMHVAGDIAPFGSERQFPYLLPDPVNGVQISELYGYRAITGFSNLGDSNPPANAPSANNRQHNADSFSQLAVSWYLPGYAWVYGKVNTVKPANQPPAMYDGQPTAPGPSSSTKRRLFRGKRLVSWLDV